MTIPTKTGTGETPAGTQTLIRGLSAIGAVAHGAKTLPAIGEEIGCTRSTTHRLVSALVAEGYIRNVPGFGYVLGPKLIELGHLAVGQVPLATIARPHLERLAEQTQDTVHLGLPEGSEVFYLDKLPGKRGLEMRSRIGLRMPLAFSAIGRALMLDMPEPKWRELYEIGREWHAAQGNAALTHPTLDGFLEKMRLYADQSCAFDLEENEANVRCVAAPIRDAAGSIVAAVSVASAAQYMPLDRMPNLRPLVIDAAAVISRELGWSGRSAYSPLG